MPEGEGQAQGTTQVPESVVSGTTPETGADVAVNTSTEEADSGPWWTAFGKRLFGMDGRADADTQGTGSSSTDDGAPEPSTGTTESRAPEGAQPPPTKREVTDEELSRLVQAEVDRREAKRQREAAKAQDPARQAAELEQQAHQVRKEDPDQANQLFDQAEALKAQQQFIGGIVQLHDQATMGALWEAVPEADRPTVFAPDDAATPLELRTKHVKAALAHLKEVWTKEGAEAAEKRIRRNPALLRQVVIADKAQEAEDDPDVLVPATPSRNGRTTNDVANEALRELILARR